MWIELHDTDGKKVLVNAEMITTLVPSCRNTYITFGRGSYMYAKESYDEVKVMIYSGGKE